MGPLAFVWGDAVAVAAAASTLSSPILPLLSFSTVYSATLLYTVSCDNLAVTHFNSRLYRSVHSISIISNMGWSRIHQILPWRSLLPWNCCHGSIGWAVNEANAGYVEGFTTMYAVSLSPDACKGEVVFQVLEGENPAGTCLFPHKSWYLVGSWAGIVSPIVSLASCIDLPAGRI